MPSGSIVRAAWAALTLLGWAGLAVCTGPLLDSILKPLCPGEDAFNARRICRDHTDRRKCDSRFGDIRVHFLEPVMRNLARTRSHIGENHGRTVREMIDERI